MKVKHILSLILLVAFNTMALAQTEEKKEVNPEKRAQKLTEKMIKHLELSEDQKKAVYEANLKLVHKKIEQKAQMKAIRDSYSTEMKAVLTPEQYEKLEKKLKHKTREGRKHSRHKHKEEKQN